MKQCCATDGVEPQYIKDEILPEFFKHFWQHRMALDRRNYKQLVDTTVELANKVGASDIIGRVVDDLKDENEQYRKMVMETIEKVCRIYIFSFTSTIIPFIGIIVSVTCSKSNCFFTMNELWCVT